MEGTITLITGTRKGIGRYLADYYINKGHKVIGCSREPLDQEINGYKHIVCNVSDEKGAKYLFKIIKQQFGKLDNLINNAAIASMNHCLTTPVQVVNNILSTNVVGTFIFCREAAKIMKQKNYGRIVNFSSVAVPLKLEGEAIYAASKAAVETLTYILARELGRWGITVNSIGPSPMPTDLIRGVQKHNIDKLINRQAILRYANFDDVTNVIDFYLRKESSFITGQVIYLGGI